MWFRKKTKKDEKAKSDEESKSDEEPGSHEEPELEEESGTCMNYCLKSPTNVDILDNLTLPNCA